MRVLFTFVPRPELRRLLEDQLPEICTLVFPPDSRHGTLKKLIGDADVVVGWKVTEDLVQAAGNVVLWQNPGAGVTRMLEIFRQHRHITLCNSHGNSYLTAQHAVALMLASMNQIHLHHMWLKGGKWRTGDDDAESVPLRRRHVGLAGYGSIGRKIARFISGFDVTVSAYKNRKRASDAEVPGVRCCYASEGASLREFFAQSDVVILTLPLTDSTRGIVSSDELQALGPAGLLVNVGRAGVVVERDLYLALKEGKVGAAALDVWWREKEPSEFSDGGLRPFNYPFHKLPNVLMSPHRAASPKDDLTRWSDVIENIRRAASGSRDFLNVVDVDRGY